MAINSKKAQTIEATPVRDTENQYDYVHPDRGDVVTLTLKDLVVNEAEEKFIVDYTFVKYALGPSLKESFREFQERLRSVIENSLNEAELIERMECYLYFKKFAMQNGEVCEAVGKDIERNRP